MQSKGFLASCKAWKPDLYLFLVALFFFFGAAHVVNILISLTVGPEIGLYFEFINAMYDRVMVYALNFIAIVYVTIRLPRKSISLLSLLALLRLFHVHASGGFAGSIGQLFCVNMVIDQP